APECDRGGEHGNAERPKAQGVPAIDYQSIRLSIEFGAESGQLVAVVVGCSLRKLQVGRHAYPRAKRTESRMEASELGNLTMRRIAPTSALPHLERRASIRRSWRSSPMSAPVSSVTPVIRGAPAPALPRSARAALRGVPSARSSRSTFAPIPSWPSPTQEAYYSDGASADLGVLRHQSHDPGGWCPVTSYWSDQDTLVLDF